MFLESKKYLGVVRVTSPVRIPCTLFVAEGVLFLLVGKEGFQGERSMGRKEFGSSHLSSSAASGSSRSWRVFWMSWVSSFISNRERGWSLISYASQDQLLLDRNVFLSACILDGIHQGVKFENPFTGFLSDMFIPDSTTVIHNEGWVPALGWDNFLESLEHLVNSLVNSSKVSLASCSLSWRARIPCMVVGRGEYWEASSLFNSSHGE